MTSTEAPYSVTFKKGQPALITIRPTSLFSEAYERLLADIPSINEYQAVLDGGTETAAVAAVQQVIPGSALIAPWDQPKVSAPSWPATPPAAPSPQGGVPVPTCAHGPMRKWSSPDGLKTKFYCNTPRNFPNPCPALNA